jgi:hypothetical protein
MTVGLTREQLFRSDVIVGTIQEFQAPLTEFQRFYGLGIGSTPHKIFSGRSGSYDITNPIRNLAQPRGPNLPHPLEVQPRVLASIPVATLRFYEKRTLRVEDFMDLRAPGGQNGVVEQWGRAHVIRESEQLVTRNRNAREFMAVRMMMGGFSVRSSGDVDYLGELGASNSLDIASRMPAAHLHADGPIGSDGSTRIFATKWTDANCDIIGQFAELDMYSARVHGAQITEIWINGSVYSDLLNITQLKNVNGIANRVFDRYTGRELTGDMGMPDTGFDVTFQALPGRVFHVYNQGFVGADVLGTYDEQTSTSNFTRFIANGKAIMTPKPGPWCGVLHGTEPICKSKFNGNVELVSGFNMWADRITHPPGEEIITIDNVLPVLLQPSAVYYTTVGTT